MTWIGSMRKPLNIALLYLCGSVLSVPLPQQEVLATDAHGSRDGEEHVKKNSATVKIEDLAAFGRLRLEAAHAVGGIAPGVNAKKAPHLTRVSSSAFRTLYGEGNSAMHQQACDSIVDKIVRLLQTQMKKKASLGLSLTTDEAQLFFDLQIDTKDADVRDLLHRTLNIITFKTALEAGEIWTQDDQELLLNACCAKDPLDKLEEHLKTRGGDMLVQGDMLVPKRQRFASPASLLMRRVVDERAPQRQPGSGWSAKLWDGGRIYHCFREDTDDSARKAFELAKAHIMLQVPCIRFEELQYSKVTETCASDKAVVVVKSDEPGCWSSVGSPEIKHERWTINLGSGCEQMGLALHQLGHALGMTHTQSRADRDGYVNLMEDNVDPSLKESNFPNNDVATMHMTFDFVSVMFGGLRAFSINGMATLTPKQQPALRHLIGQRMGLSEGDVEQLSTMYGCKDKIRPFTRTSMLAQRFAAGEGLTSDGTCADALESDKTSIPSENSSNSAKLSCTEAESGCWEFEHMSEVRATCPRTCLMCLPVPERVTTLRRRDGDAMFTSEKEKFAGWFRQFFNYTNETARDT